MLSSPSIPPPSSFFYLPHDDNTHHLVSNHPHPPINSNYSPSGSYIAEFGVKIIPRRPRNPFIACLSQDYYKRIIKSTLSIPMTKRIDGIKQIAGKYSTYFFDLDGVIWKGSQKVKGGVETLHFLRENKKRIFFITNSSLRNRQMLKDRFATFGFEAELDEIYPSDYITRKYVGQKYPHLKKLLVIGAQSLYQEIKKSGKEAIHLSSMNLIESVNAGSQQFKISIDPSIDGVIMGYDKNLTYNEIVLISAYVQSGAKFIGTNPDKYTIVGDYKIPGCGSMIKCIQSASSINAEYAGKPNPFIIDFLIQSLKLSNSECLMIGDNLQTDITFGKNGGIDSLCVLTGVSTQSMVKESNLPTYYAEYLL